MAMNRRDTTAHASLACRRRDATAHASTEHTMSGNEKTNSKMGEICAIPDAMLDAMLDAMSDAMPVERTSTPNRRACIGLR